MIGMTIELKKKKKKKKELTVLKHKMNLHAFKEIPIELF